MLGLPLDQPCSRSAVHETKVTTVTTTSGAGTVPSPGVTVRKHGDHTCLRGEHRPGKCRLSPSTSHGRSTIEDGSRILGGRVPSLRWALRNPSMKPENEGNSRDCRGWGRVGTRQLVSYQRTLPTDVTMNYQYGTPSRARGHHQSGNKESRMFHVVASVKRQSPQAMPRLRRDRLACHWNANEIR